VPSLDHLAYAVPDVAHAAEWLEGTTGVRAAPGGRHTGLGSRNALAALPGGAYLELIGPDPEQPDVDLSTHPFGLAELQEPRLVTWAVSVEGIEERVAAARDRGYDPGGVLALHRERPDGVVLRWQLTRRDELSFGGVVPFLIEWVDSPHPSEAAPTGLRLVAFSASHPRPEEVRSALAAIEVELEVVEGPRASLRAVIQGPEGAVELR
jgi:hypothetical protein